MSGNTSLGQSDSSPIPVLTVTPEAAERFVKALSYATGLVENQADSNQAPVTKAKIEEHREWLDWGNHMIRHALHEAGRS